MESILCAFLLNYTIKEPLVCSTLIVTPKHYGLQYFITIKAITSSYTNIEPTFFCHHFLHYKFYYRIPIFIYILLHNKVIIEKFLTRYLYQILFNNRW